MESHQTLKAKHASLLPDSVFLCAAGTFLQGPAFQLEEMNHTLAAEKLLSEKGYVPWTEMWLCWQHFTVVHAS